MKKTEIEIRSGKTVDSNNRAVRRIKVRSGIRAGDMPRNHNLTRTR